MVRELVKVELYGANNNGGARRYTIADGVNVSQGALMELLDPRTCSVAVLASKVFAGVAAEAHNANEGVTAISVWTDGIFEAYCSGSVVLGQPITGTHGNYVLGNGTASGAQLLGYSLETGSADEVVNVRLNL